MLFDIKKTEYATAAKAGTISPRLISARSVVSAAFPVIEPETEYPFATGAEWSTHDLISHILETTGPAHLVACRWSMEAHAAEKLMILLGAGNLLSVSMLVDWRVQVRNPHALKLGEMNFAKIRVTSCHAKVFCLHNDTWSVSCVGSANFTNNPRIEAGHLSTSKKITDFHRAWILEEIDNAKPFGIDMRKAGHDGRK
jgi:hypothetical protein